MNDAIIIILIILIALLFVFFIVRSRSEDSKKRHVPNYRALFILGVTWIPIGIGTENPGLWMMGIVFMIVGAINKKKWGQETKWADMTPSTKRAKIIIVSALSILLLALLIVFFLTNSD
jgi:hypothetical protein